MTETDSGSAPSCTIISLEFNIYNMDGGTLC